MTVIDLNADLAESDAVTPSDLALLDLVTSASLACGFHAGSRSAMSEAAAACVERGVVIGAHVSYRDRDGFGRMALDVAPATLAADLVEQWDTLVDEVAAAGGTVSYVKPHGALYNRMSVDADVARVVVEALGPRCAVLVAPPRSAASAPARAGGVRLVAEGFCDRGYDELGRLVPRGSHGALVDDPDLAAARALSLVVERGVDSIGGRWVPLEVETVCLHGDRPDADRRARTVRDALRDAGVLLRPFAPVEDVDG
ncbi:MAG: 5-oxoprolinase subunit PxpA [Acidimicrobiales bacterium]